MKRGLALGLLTLVLAGLLAALGLRESPNRTDSLSVLALRPREGNALVVNCNRQALLLPLGDGAEDSRLAEYLNSGLLRRHPAVSAPRFTAWED